MSSDERVWTALTRGGQVRDVAVLSGVPAVLLAVFALPLGLRESLVLSYAAPTVVTAYVSHFVHLTGSHLATNLAAYVLVASLAYAYCTMSGRREGFLVTFVVFVVAFPFALSALNVALVRPRVGYGFSGVNAAFYGFLPVALVWYGRDRFALALRLDHAPALFFLGAGIIALRAVPSTTRALLLAGFAVIVAGGYVASVAADVSVGVDDAVSGGHGHLELAAVGLVLFLSFPFVAFPARVAGGGAVVNVYTHLLGYCLGFIGPYVTFRVT